METSSPSDWRAGLRTVIFALLAVAVILSMVASRQVPFAERIEPRKAELLVRGGNTFMDVSYLLLDAGWSSEEIEPLLHRAREFYQASLKADPSSLKAVLSLALVLHMLDYKSEAIPLVPKLYEGMHTESLRVQLSAVSSLLISEKASLSALENAHDSLMGRGPGMLFLALGYEETGDHEQALQILDAAARQAQPLRRALFTAVIVNGAIVLCGIVFLARTLVFGRRSHPETKPLDPPSWSLKEATEALILWVFLGVVLTSAAKAVLSEGREGPVWMLLLPSFLAAGLAIVWVWGATGCRSGFGWIRSQLLRHFAVGVSATGLAVLPILWIYSLFQNVLGQSPADDPVLPLLIMPDTIWAKALLIVLVGGLAPAFEETLFRGILYRGLRIRWPFLPAAAMSAALFAIAHVHLAGFTAYAILGFLFAYLFERTNSLVTPWAAHAAFNTFNLVVLFVIFG